MDTKFDDSRSVTSITMKFTDSSSRHAEMYGNGWNQVPVTVAVSIVDGSGPVTGLNKKDLADSLSFYYSKNDQRVAHGVAIENNKGLNAAQVSLGFNHAKYSNPGVVYTTPDVTEKNGTYKITYYLSSTEENANFEIYAGFKYAGMQEVFSEQDKSLSFTVLPKISWCSPSLWDTSKESTNYYNDISDRNVCVPLDPVTRLPVAGHVVHSTIALRVKYYVLRYKGNHTLPPFKVRGGKLSRKSEFYDLGNNSQACLISSNDHFVTSKINKNETGLLYAQTTEEGIPVLKGKIKFTVGTDPDSSGIYKQIYLETIDLPTENFFAPLINDGITLHQVTFEHNNTKLFATNSPDSHVRKEMTLDICDDFGNHGSIIISIKNSFQLNIAFDANSQPPQSL